MYSLVITELKIFTENALDTGTRDQISLGEHFESLSLRCYIIHVVAQLGYTCIHRPYSRAKHQTSSGYYSRIQP